MKLIYEQLLTNPTEVLELDMVEIYEQGFELIKPTNRILGAFPDSVIDKEGECNRTCLGLHRHY